MPNPSECLAELRLVVGERYVLTDPADLAPHLVDWRGRYRGQALALVRPASTAEVATVVQTCVKFGVPMVPQGGHTSLCGASTPDERGDAVIISLSRLNEVITVDAQNNTLSVGAGCTLQQVQAAAEAADRLFPLSLASEGTCQIGGNLSTNAGGVQVLRYGNMRELTLGLEVVLPNGEIWQGMRALRKDNTGYDLKDLFIGAEGTLGIITAAVLKLFPRPRRQTTLWLNLASPALAVDLLNRAKNRFDAQLTAFELISAQSLGLVLQHMPETRLPSSAAPWYVLAEFSDTPPEALEGWLAEQLDAERLLDGVIAQTEAQAKALWALRENISEAQKREGFSIKHDIAVAVSAIPEFLRLADTALQAAFPGIRVIAFGHVGDGNLHYNLSRPGDLASSDFLACQPEVNRIVHDTVHALNGSISAEHGIGQLKRDELLRYKSEVELNLMRSIKTALDPLGLMNPGKILA